MKTDSEVFSAVCGYINTHQEEIIDMWRRFVDQRSDATDKKNADIMADLVAEELEKLGCKCTFYDVGEKNGRALEGVLGEDRPGKPVIFTGHYDTVPLKGDYPFHIDEEKRAHGLGCLDMKGGIVMSIWVVKALSAAGWEERPVRFVFVGDEENAHQGGSTKQFLLSHGGGGVCAFNMETGLVNNAICIGRKGTGQAEIRVYGHAAHSGNNYQEGRSAITEMAAKIPQIEALTDLEKNTTVAVTMINGGTVSNSIPPVCSCIADLRFGSVAERERVVKALEEICRECILDGTKAEFEFREFMAPLDSAPQVLALADFVDNISEKYGFGRMGRVFLGGGSDASFILLAGTPVICSIGVRGEFNHSDREYALVESMFERAKLLAMAVCHISEFENH